MLSRPLLCLSAVAAVLSAGCRGDPRCSRPPVGDVTVFLESEGPSAAFAASVVEIGALSDVGLRRYRLRETGGMLGGESSGHILCLDRTTTGDGIVSALQVLGVMVESGRALHELLSPLQKCPQVLINVPVHGAASDLLQAPAVRQAVEEVEARLGQEGRVLLRPSGTEPLIRVMVEGSDKSLVSACAEQIAASVRASA